MKQFTNLSKWLVTAVVCFGIAGCRNESSDSTSGPNEQNPTADGTGDGHHAHPHHGPRGGDLVELGTEDFHAEIVHGDGNLISIYILGSDAKTAVPIDADEVTVNLSHDGKPEQFKLAASPDKGDPAGKSSRFVADDAELTGHLHEDHARARLVVVIDGKQYIGKIEHDHDHQHDHAHGPK